MKVVCIGDSITYGYSISRRDNWIGLINNKYKVDFINKGINGDTSGGMLSRFYRDVVDEKPKFVIIMGGANDFIAGNSLEAVKANIMAMIHQAIYNKIIPIIGINIKMDIKNIRKDWASITEFDQINYKICEYREWILNFCKVFYVKYIDFYAEFENKINGDYRSYLTDGIHPSKEGHKMMADIVCDHLSKEIDYYVK